MCLMESNPNLKVEVRAADFREGEGILLRDISVQDARRLDPGPTHLFIPEAFFACDADWRELADGRPNISAIELREPRLRICRLPNGQWDGIDLLSSFTMDSLPPGGNSLSLTIIDGVVEVLEPFTNAEGEVEFHTTSFCGLRLEVDPLTLDENGERIAMFRGSLDDERIRNIEFEGHFSVDSGFWDVQGLVERLQYSPGFLDALPSFASSPMEKYRSLEVQADANFHFWRDSDSPRGFRFRIEGSAVNGRWNDPSLEHPVIDLRAEFDITDELAVVRNVTASVGETRLEAAFQQRNYTEKGAAAIAFNATNLQMGADFRRLLPESISRHWTKYDPSGLANLRGELAFDGETWTPRHVVLECLDFGFSYYQCPYRLEHGRGTIILDGEGRLTSDILASSNDRPIRIIGSIENVLGESHGWIQARATELPINEKMLNALPPQARRSVQMLAPRGDVASMGNVAVEVILRSEQPGEPFGLWARVDLLGCMAEYAEFAYPLYELTGSLVLDQGQWTFSNLEARNDTAIVRGGGRLLQEEGRQHLAFQLEASQLALDEELHNAFSSQGVRELWDNLKLRGMIDVTAFRLDMISMPGHPPETTLVFDAVPYPDISSIEPTWFPVRLEKLDGQIHYRDGQVVIDQFQGENGRSRIASSVRCDFQNNGAWVLSLEDLSVDQLEIDRQFLNAAPSTLQAAIEPLELEGAVNLSGRFSVSKPAAVDAPIRTDWNINAALHQANAKLGVPVESICGGVKFIGTRSGDMFECFGLIDIDSMLYKNIHMTSVRGPLRFSGGRVLIGRAATHSESQEPRSPFETSNITLLALREQEGFAVPEPITARTFDGLVECDGWVAFQDTEAYHLWMQATSLDMASVARDFSGEQRDVEGLIDVQMEIGGRRHSLNTMKIDGKLSIHNANLYELPVMTDVRQGLGVGEQDEQAGISEADILFQVRGGRILLPGIEFRGNAFSLKGNGAMSFDQELQLQLGARLGGRENPTVPILREFLGAAGEQLVILEVNGTLSAPEVTRKPFPGIAEALDQLQGNEAPAPPGEDVAWEWGVAPDVEPTRTAGPGPGAGIRF